MKNLTILALLFVALFSSCNNDDDGSANDCQEGCLEFNIDGSLFRTELGVGVLNNIVGATTVTLGNFNNPSLSEIGILSIAIGPSFTLEETTYMIDEDCNASNTLCIALAYGDVDPSDPTSTISYSSDPLGLNITFTEVDLVSGGILSGTFSGEVENVEDPDDRKTVTNGRFNIRIN